MFRHAISTAVINSIISTKKKTIAKLIPAFYMVCSADMVEMTGAESWRHEAGN